MLIDRVTLRLTPFIRIVLPFIAGIVTAMYSPLPLVFALGASVAFTVLFVLLHRNRHLNRSYSKRWIYGTVLTLLFAFLGHAWLQLYNTNPLKSLDEQPRWFQGHLVDPPETTENAVKTLIRVEAVRDSNGHWHQQKGQLLAYLEQDSNAMRLQYGDRIAFRSRLSPVTNAGNPSEFNYKQYLARRNIHFMTWISADQWLTHQGSRGNIIMLRANQLRRHLLNYYRESGISGQNFEVAAALTLGFKDYLKDETRAKYSSSGAMHILAVSGLHMGIIFLIFNQLFSLIPLPKKLVFIRPLAVISMLWAFAVLTGLSPSVMRASVMFSFVVAGKHIERPTNIYNTLAASAFVLLVFNPFLISYVGFQLSYLAVLAIVYFQPRIYKALYVPNKWLDKIWALVAVSIAAQIGTGPVAMYYFHQFPNYFMLTNIFVIPAATAILYVAIAAFIFSWVPLVNTLLTFLLKIALTGLNWGVDFIRNLPGAVSKQLPLHLPELLMLYAAILLTAVFLANRRARALQLALVVMVVFMGIKIFRSLHDYGERSFYVYNTREGLVMNYMHGNTSTLLVDTTAYRQEDSRAYATSEHLLAESVHERKLIPLKPPGPHLKPPGSDRLIALPGLQALLLHKDTYLPDTLDFKPDVLILNGFPAKKLPGAVRQLQPDYCILPASTSWYYRQAVKDLKQLPCKLHDVAAKGAFALEDF